MKEIKGLLYTPDFDFKPGVLFIKGHIIEEVKYLTESELSKEEKERLILPGLVDIHMHGCMGIDFCSADADGLVAMADYEKRNGVTSFCPATMTLPVGKLTEQLNLVAKSNIPHIMGIYLEGPFISEKYKGAQDGRYILAPDIELVRELNRISGGRIKIVTLAPEGEGAMEMLAAGVGEFSFSIAHSGADYATASKAILKGVSHITHLYNGMPGYHHREPGIIGAAMDNGGVMVELIADGVHLHPSVVKNAFRIFGRDRVILTINSMEATGLEEGEYSLGGQAVCVKGKRACLEDGTIAGSASNLYECMINVMNMGVSPGEAIRAATFNPALAIGAEDVIGSLRKGLRADILIVSPEYQILDVIC